MRGVSWPMARLKPRSMLRICARCTAWKRSGSCRARIARQSSRFMAVMPCDAELALAALVLEACIGYPRALFALIGHPVTWIGRLLALLERAWNQPRFSEGARRVLGVAAVMIALAL